MTIIDPISFWYEPAAITEWGGECNPPITPAWLDYINFQLHPDDLAIFCRVILPAFVVVEGITLLKMNASGHSEENIIKFARQAKSDEDFERNFNILKIYDLFSHAEVQHKSSFELAANLLKRSWEISLSVAFPEERFKVFLSDTDRDYGPTISFCRCRNGALK